MTMKNFLNRAGTKLYIKDDIIQLIPKHKIYVEAFFGAGAIFNNKPVSEVEIINDLDTDLMSTNKIIQNLNSFNFIKDIDTIEKMENFYFDYPIKTDEDFLTKQLIKYNNGFHNRIISNKIYKKINPYNKLKNINLYKERLQGTTILNLDYTKVIEKYDSKETFFYLDPPYEESDKVIYKHNKFNYEELKNILQNIKGLFLLSINNSEYIRKLFNDFHIKEIEIKTKPIKRNIAYCRNEKYRKELLITNYKI